MPANPPQTTSDPALLHHRNGHDPERWCLRARNHRQAFQKVLVPLTEEVPSSRPFALKIACGDLDGALDHAPMPMDTIL